jgi:hypothetical protein
MILTGSVFFFHTTFIASVKGLYLPCVDKLHSLEKRTLPKFAAMKMEADDDIL